MLSLEDFVELVKSSGLVEEAAWQRWHAQNAAACSDSEQMAESLVAAGLITPWHRDKLLEGKNRGFFLGRFKILGQLGAGSMGAVYLAEHTVMRHRVAIKVMASRLQGSTRHIERFEREARATAAVNHPRIVRAFDVEMSGDTPYLVMEYVEGEDLQKIVLRDGVMSPKVAAKCIRQSAEGLQAAHQAGLVHRDIKPSNILLDKSGEIHILDLGLARLDAGEEASLTMMHNSRALGTVDYLAPEQARDSHTVDARADIYSLGCTLYFLLTGHPPFDQGTIPQRLLAHQHQQPEDLCKVRDDVPEALAAICRKMLVKERARRYQAAAEVEADLAAFLAGKPTSLAGEEDLLRIDLAEEEVPAPAKAAPPAEAPAAAAAVAQVAATAASVAAAASGSAGSSPSSGSSSAAALSLPPIEAPDPFGGPALPVGTSSSPLVPLAPLATTDLMPLGSSVLQPIAPPSGAAIETMSGLMETTQSIPKQQLAAARSLQPAAPAQPSLRQTIVQLVAEPAKEGEGIGGLKYKLWFLIVFGILSGLILAGVGYSIMRTYNPQPAPEKAGFER
jgi:serine/threonine protein kinase